MTSQDHHEYASEVKRGDSQFAREPRFSLLVEVVTSARFKDLPDLPGAGEQCWSSVECKSEFQKQKECEMVCGLGDDEGRGQRGQRAAGKY